jgi:hypothetical protein
MASQVHGKEAAWLQRRVPDDSYYQLSEIAMLLYGV